MELRFSPLFSGSSGNAIYVGCDDAQILVDAGMSGTRVIQELLRVGVDPASLDAILVTHEHADHFDRMALTQLVSSNTVVFSNPNVGRLYGNARVMKNGEKVVFGDSITLEAVPAYNTTPGREQMHPKGRDNGYILTLDGLRIYVAGDTEDIPEMADIKNIDIAFLPCNQPYTMTTDQLGRAAKTIRPKVLFPYHYNNTPVSRIKVQLSGSGIDVRIRNYQ